MSVTETRQIFGEEAIIGYVEANPVEVCDRLVYGVACLVDGLGASRSWDG